VGPYNTIAAVEAEAARRLTTLDTTDFRQGLKADLELVWSESIIPLTAQADSVLAQHLTFSCSIEDAPVRRVNNEPGQGTVVDAVLAVGFWYRIRPGSQIIDYRLASEAARKVNGVITALWPGVDVAEVNLWRPGPIVNGWLPVVMAYVASFEISNSPLAVP
jgi:hypothetical protein